MDTLLQDLKYAVRQLARTPSTTTVVALTLAIGIGANTALFSLANAVLARPLPGIGAPEGLVWLTPHDVHNGPRALMLSYRDFLDFRDSTGAFTSAAALGRAEFSISSGGEPTRVHGALVSGNFFNVLQVRLALGRGFTADDDRAGTPNPVAVISHRLWQERFAGSSTVVGRRIIIDGRTFTIVGVTPERFNGPDHAERRDVWVPISLAGTALPGFSNLLADRGAWWLAGIGRLAPGVSVDRADAAMATVAARLANLDSATHGGLTASVQRMRGGLGPNDGNDIMPVAALATTVTVLILLIACANVSNLLLGRGVARRREIAVRLSLGAGRPRLIRQLLTEAMLLAALGGVAGSLVALWATDVLASIIPAPIDVSPDRAVLAFVTAAACITGIAFGLVPALSATRADVTTVLKDASAGSDRSRARLQRGFVVAQISLSLVLLVTAGTFLSQLYKSSRVDVHFDATDRVLAASFDLGLQGYTPERANAFLDQAAARVVTMPGVEAVSFTNQVPMSERHIGTEITIQGDRDASQRFGEHRGVEVYESTIRPSYFATVGIPLARGRDFTGDDREGAELVAIVSEDFARTAWPGGDAIGKRISTNGDGGPYMTITGVAREALTYGLGERRRPIVYVAQAQHPSALDLTLLVRRSGPAVELANAIRAALREIDRDLPIYDVQTLAQYRYDRGAESRMGSILLSIFGGLALLLAMIGVYGVMAFAASQRTREIGVRAALGAARADIVKLLVSDSVRLAAIGVAIGLVLSYVVAKTLAAAFLGLSVGDALVFGGGALLLALATVAASWLPATRAAKTDPMVALRAESSWS